MKSYNEATIISMSKQEESALWRQRYFEAQAGMERFLAEKYGCDEIEKWLPVKAQILDGLNGGLPDMDDVRSWKERFFKTQALLEKYLDDHHCLDDMEGWTAATSQVFKHTEPNRGGGAADLALRLARQAYCYGSDFEIEHLGPDNAKFSLLHCAIWDYREHARETGVHITLKSPCSYCTQATVANIRAKGYVASYQLSETDSDHGCTWEINNEHA